MRLAANRWVAAPRKRSSSSARLETQMGQNARLSETTAACLPLTEALMLNARVCGRTGYGDGKSLRCTAPLYN